uniref:Uncharacterized protein n=1 Tax=Onchocerca volvulus TaxID=6282 RepID=A0A8R1XL57_ONCVO
MVENWLKIVDCNKFFKDNKLSGSRSGHLISLLEFNDQSYEKGHKIIIERDDHMASNDWIKLNSLAMRNLLRSSIMCQVNSRDHLHQTAKQSSHDETYGQQLQAERGIITILWIAKIIQFESLMFQTAGRLKEDITEKNWEIPLNMIIQCMELLTKKLSEKSKDVIIVNKDLKFKYSDDSFKGTNKQINMFPAKTLRLTAKQVKSTNHETTQIGDQKNEVGYECRNLEHKGDETEKRFQKTILIGTHLISNREDASQADTRLMLND